MNEAGGGDHFSALANLPPDIAQRSISKSSIILPLDAAIAAVDHMARAGRALENWEGWLRLSDGARTRSLAVNGSFAMSHDATRAAENAKKGMREASERWNRNPEYPGAQLYFGLTFGRNHG